VLRISKRPEPVNIVHCPSCNWHEPFCYSRRHHPTPKNTLRGNPGCVSDPKHRQAPRPERLRCCFRCRLLPLGRSVAARPPHGCRLRRVRAGYAQVLPAPSTAPGGRTTRRTPRGRYSCSGTTSARTGVRTCRCALGRPPFTVAVLVGRWPLSSVLRWWCCHR
jgi:hypothetical protein